MRHYKILVLLLAFVLVMSGVNMAQEEKEKVYQDKEIYEKAYKSIYKKQWESAIEYFDALPGPVLRDEFPGFHCRPR